MSRETVLSETAGMRRLLEDASANAATITVAVADTSNQTNDPDGLDIAGKLTSAVADAIKVLNELESWTVRR